MNFVFIGMGGTNSLLIRPFLMFLKPKDISPKKVVIIDGDNYSVDNLTRQDFNPDFVNVNKAEAKAQEFSKLFPEFQISAYPEYLDESNVSYYVQDGDTVLMAVDCMKTRKVVDNYCLGLENTLLISMGNEMQDGDAHFMCRVHGEFISPSIQLDHPEIANAEDRSRSEMSCEEIAALPSGGQLIIANLMSAITGMSIAWTCLEKTDFLRHTAQLKYRGAYFDAGELKMRPVTNHIIADEGRGEKLIRHFPLEGGR